jgi:hypothetical protein
MALWDPPFTPAGLDPAAAATVSCFVDRVRLQGYHPVLALVFLRGRYGQAQIQRLINGVGTPNLSFAELRSLLLPRLDDDACAAFVPRLARAWREAAAQRDVAALKRIVHAVELLIEGAQPAL